MAQLPMNASTTEQCPGEESLENSPLLPTIPSSNSEESIRTTPADDDRSHDYHGRVVEGNMAVNSSGALRSRRRCAAPHPSLIDNSRVDHDRDTNAGNFEKRLKRMKTRQAHGNQTNAISTVDIFHQLPPCPCQLSSLDL
mmetsp:Transcript_5186/g.10583  ORF Transcript_5186/g.10583 Transcript_5186/m.10583 type:complete len:140 (-) Transcript_5186:164-583(-)